MDNDCDGETDEGVMLTFYLDGDGDGYGIADTTTAACEPPDGYAPEPGDCDDGDSAISPGTDEVCDSTDNDCDSLIDDDDDSLDTATGTVWYADDDGDGYGDPDNTVETSGFLPPYPVMRDQGVAHFCYSTHCLQDLDPVQLWYGGSALSFTRNVSTVSVEKPIGGGYYRTIRKRWGTSYGSVELSPQSSYISHP